MLVQCPLDRLHIDRTLVRANTDTEKGKWRGTHRGYHTPDQNAQSKPLKALVPASQRFLQLSCRRKTLRPELCAANVRQGFRKLHVPTVASFSVLRLCGESFACTQLRPMRVPLFGQSVSYVADSRPPPRSPHISTLRRNAKGRIESALRAARATTTAAQCGPGRVMRVNTVLAPALQAMHTDKSCVSLFVPDHKTKLEFITFDCTATRRNSPSMRRPTSQLPQAPGTVRLKRARRLSRRSRGTATLDASAISACEASRAACCPWRRQMRSAWRSSHCSRRPRRALPPAQGLRATGTQGS